MKIKIIDTFDVDLFQMKYDLEITYHGFTKQSIVYLKDKGIEKLVLLDAHIEIDSTSMIVWGCLNKKDVGFRCKAII